MRCRLSTRWLVGINLHLLALYAIDRVECWMANWLDLPASEFISLTLRYFYRLSFLALRARIILIVDRIIRTAILPYLTNLVLITHTLIPLLLVVFLMLHLFPSFDVSIHLICSATFYHLLSLYFLLTTHVLVILGKVLRISIQRMLEMGRLRIRVIHLCVIDKLIEPANVLADL